MAHRDDLAARWAPVVRLLPEDPPGDPAPWLRECDLVAYAGDGAPHLIGPVAETGSWPAASRDRLARPFAGADAAEFALVPRRRHPKLVARDHDGRDGRVHPGNGMVQAPCFHDLRPIADGVRIDYWFFFPTSTTPANAFLAMLPLVIAALSAGEISGEAFPPICVQLPRNGVDRFWERVAARGGFLRQLTESARAGGALTNALPVLIAQLAGTDGGAITRGLDATTQERLASLYVHEGDWEGITVELDDAGSLRQVVYWGHGHPIVVPAAQVSLARAGEHERPVVLVAAGSHASVPEPRPGVTPDLVGLLGGRVQQEVLPAATAAVWHTWEQLRPVSAEPWFGFGGAWGRPRLAPLGRLERRSLAGKDLWRESTGPLGPGPVKAQALDDALLRLNQHPRVAE